MYTLSDFIGKETFNRALGNFIEKYRYKSDPYPNIGQFINSIRAETPGDLQYLITDTFEKITLYENKAKSSTAILNNDGTYSVNIVVEAKKVYSDSLGIQSDGDLNDWLEIGILGEVVVDGKIEELPIYLEKVLITDSLTTFQVNVKEKPLRAGIDPMHKFVDRDSEDNLIKVSLLKVDTDENRDQKVINEEIVKKFGGDDRIKTINVDKSDQ